MMVRKQNNFFLFFVIRKLTFEEKCGTGRCLT